MKISIIIPMYNTQNIKRILEGYIKDIEKITADYEMIVVDDGSTNNCLYEAKKLKNSKVRILGYEKNLGKGNAVRFGFRYASGKYVAFLDSGGEFKASQLGDFLKIIEKEKADAVIGSKRHVNSKVHYPPARKLMSLAYQTINKILFDLDIKDTQAGIKLFKREVLEKIMPKILVKRFAFDVELLALANKEKFKIIEAPVVLDYDFKSTINPKSVLLMLWDTFAVFYRLKIIKWYEKNEKED